MGYYMAGGYYQAGGFSFRKLARWTKKAVHSPIFKLATGVASFIPGVSQGLGLLKQLDPTTLLHSIGINMPSEVSRVLSTLGPVAAPSGMPSEGSRPLGTLQTNASYNADEAAAVRSFLQMNNLHAVRNRRRRRV